MSDSESLEKEHDHSPSRNIDEDYGIPPDNGYNDLNDSSMPDSESLDNELPSSQHSDGHEHDWMDDGQNFNNDPDEDSEVMFSQFHTGKGEQGDIQSFTPAQGTTVAGVAFQPKALASSPVDSATSAKFVPVPEASMISVMSPPPILARTQDHHAHPQDEPAANNGASVTSAGVSISRVEKFAGGPGLMGKMLGDISPAEVTSRPVLSLGYLAEPVFSPDLAVPVESSSTLRLKKSQYSTITSSVSGSELGRLEPVAPETTDEVKTSMYLKAIEAKMSKGFKMQPRKLISYPKHDELIGKDDIPHNSAACSGLHNTIQVKIPEPLDATKSGLSCSNNPSYNVGDWCCSAMKHFLPGSMLNDESINHTLGLFRQNDVAILSSLSSRLTLPKDQRQVSLRMAIVPIHHKDTSHWTVAVLEMGTRRIDHYDSWRSDPPLSSCEESLRSFARGYSRDRGIPEDWDYDAPVSLSNTRLPLLAGV